MPRSALLVLIAALALHWARAAPAQEVALQVAANRDRIYLGESVQLTVQVANADDAAPDLSAIRGCAIRSLGSRSESRFVLENGRFTSFSGRTFVYELTPSAAGPFVAGPVRLVVGSRALTETGPRIEVTGVEQQTRVLISVVSSKESVLADESFDITLAIAVERLKGRFAEVEPLDPGDPPHLSVPFLAGPPMPGLDSPSAQDILQPRLAPRADAPGFTLNNFTVRSDPLGSPFNFNLDDFMRERPAKFTLDRRVVEHDGRSYFEYALKLGYTAREEASYTFGPVVFKGRAVVGVDAGNAAVGQQIFAVGPACTVRVVPPPDEGRPRSFVGAIGTSLAAKAALDAQTCNVGDPLTLTLTISGDVTLNNIYPPPLSAQPELTRDFKVYDGSVRVTKKEAAREFSYTIRPTRAGTLELPAIELAYFDSAARVYRTVRTQPIPVRANAAAEVPAVILADTNRQARSVEIETAAALTIAPVDMDPAGAEDADLLRAGWNGWLAGAGPALCCLVFAGRTVGRYAARRARTAGSRHALSRANAALDAARATADPAQALRLLVAALGRYGARRLGAAAAGLTPGDARRLLAERNLPPELAERFCEVFERAFCRVYAGGGGYGAGDVRRDIEVAGAVLAEFERYWRDSARRTAEET